MSTLEFRRWYEHQLYRSFAWLTTSLLSGVLIAALLEMVGLGGSGARLIGVLVAVYLLGLLSVDGFRRFWMLLSRAQHCSDAATCAGCGGYGLFEVHPESAPFTACCRRCGHRWLIE